MVSMVSEKRSQLSSCKIIYFCSLSTAPSGCYWITTSNGSIAIRMYCAMNLTQCGNTTGGWTRVAYINMTDPTVTCPGGLRNINIFFSKESVWQSTSKTGCSSVTLHLRVCTPSSVGEHWATSIMTLLLSIAIPLL